MYFEIPDGYFSLKFEPNDFPYHQFYYKMFGKLGHLISMTYGNEKYENLNRPKPIINLVKQNIKKNDRPKSLKIDDTFQSILSYLKDNNIDYYMIRLGSMPVIFTANDEMIYMDRVLDLTIISSEDKLPEWCKNCIIYDDVPNTYFYVIRGTMGFDTRCLSAKDIELDTELNYNDDFPVDKLDKVLNQDGSALVILHGAPGTGKSSYIKSLIKTSQYKCMYVDQSCFDFLTDSTFITLLIDFKSSIVILEDCECLLAERKNTRNNAIAALLNLTDGVLADAFNLKIICTFNADLNKIDKALLRKGRLKLKYEFKNLTKDKVKNFFAKKYPELTAPDKEMSLADLYNYTDTADLSSDNKRSVGFKKFDYPQ